MTKEEVIEIFERFVLGAKPCSQREIVDACASAYGMLKERPSEDLEKVAEEFGKRQGIELAPFAQKFFKAGAQWQKEQMMKDAVEYDVDGCGYLIPKDKGGILAAYPFDEHFPSKVKVIIVKED